MIAGHRARRAQPRERPGRRPGPVPRLPQRVAAGPRRPPVAEVGVRGGAGGQGGGLLLRSPASCSAVIRAMTSARSPRLACPAGSRPMRAATWSSPRVPQRVQQGRDAGWVGEVGVPGGVAATRAATWLSAPTSAARPAGSRRRPGHRGRRARRHGRPDRQPDPALSQHQQWQQVRNGGRITGGRRARRGHGRSGQRSGPRPPLPAARQQVRNSVRVTEGGVPGGARATRAAAWSCAPACRSARSRDATACGSSRGACAAARAARA